MGPHDLRAALDALSSERLMAHVTEFSRWTKHAGTQEELRSLEYVEGVLRAEGYAVQRIVHDAYISLPGNASLIVGDQVIPTIVHSFSRPTDEDGLRAPLVDVRAGDVAGKIVLTDGTAHPRTLADATRRGAVAQIYISPDRHRHEMCVSPVWGSPDDVTVESLPNLVVLSVSAEDGLLLRAAAATGETAHITASVDTGWRPTPILVAELSSLAGPADEPFVLLSGHHDTWYLGVMDNGGANATMLEVARICAAFRTDWRRGLRIIFWSGHSQGRYSSSAWYADHHWEELEARAVAHVNIDSTGGVGHAVVSDAPASAELAGLAREVLEAQAGQVFGGRPMSRAGDQSFWGIGVPSIFANMGEQADDEAANDGEPKVGPGTGWWWHTPEDTIERIDPVILERDARIYLHAVWRLLASDVVPLDYAAVAREIVDTLAGLQDRIGNHLDLSAILDRAVRLLESAERFNASPPPAPEADRQLRSLSRILVPFIHTTGNRFEHDPALPLMPMSGLLEADRLADLDPTSDAFRFLSTRVQRNANRVGVVLREAIRTLES